MKGADNFIASTPADYMPAYAVEICGCLAVLQSIEYFPSELKQFSKIDVCMETYCLGVTRKLDKQATVTRMTNKVHPIACEFFCLNTND